MALLIHGDAAGVRKEWGAFLAEIAKQPLLYVPSVARRRCAEDCRGAHGAANATGTAAIFAAAWFGSRDMVNCCACSGDGKRSSTGPGAVTESIDCSRSAIKGLSRVWSNRRWTESAIARLARSRQRSRQSMRDSDPTADVQLIDCLQQVTESLLSEWLSHSRTLRLSVMERVGAEKPWQELVKFMSGMGTICLRSNFFIWEICGRFCIRAWTCGWSG